MNTKSGKSFSLNGAARYRIVGVVFVLVSLVVFQRVLRIMYVEGDRWREIASRINRPQEKPLYPTRGTIFSSDGEELAITAPHYRLKIDFRAGSFIKLERDTAMAMLDRLANTMAEYLSTPDKPVSAKKLKERWMVGYKKKSRSWLLIGRDISYLELKELYKKPPFVKENGKPNYALRRCVVQEERSKRINPFGSLGRRTIGSVYSAVDSGYSLGKGGLELAFDKHLRGELGSSVEIYNEGKKVSNTVREPRRGADVYSTLDMRKQAIVEYELRSSLERAEAESGTAVLMEVETGKVLAISNLGRLKSGEYGETQNFAVSDLSEPGSTFKTVSMLIALDRGLCSPQDTVDVGNGMWVVGKRTLRDWTVGKRAGLGRISYAEAMHQSSNVGISKLIYKHFKDCPQEYVKSVRRLGICDNFELEIPGAAKHAIVRMPGEGNYWSSTTLPWMSHGYETQIPPISTLAFYNAIANGGKFMKPYFVNRVVSSDGEVLVEHSPKVLRDSIASSRAIASIKDILRGVVTDGTAKKGASSDKVAICGKTGTAVIGTAASGYSERNYQISFAGFFPYEKPKYSMIVVVRKPVVPEYRSAGIACGGVVRKVAETIFSIENRFPIDSLHRSEYHTPQVQGGSKDALLSLSRLIGLPIDSSMALDQKTTFVRALTVNGKISLRPAGLHRRGIVPNVVGMAPSDAVYLLSKCGYRAVLTGAGMVQAQSVPAGSRLAVRHKVHLQLGSFAGKIEEKERSEGGGTVQVR
ncbi:MAG: penicillin-binding transpeptidase domain-containing protein [Porphyromonas sp.]|nr:penicillin-binding transpeptidase domain-containing protein [Porphyromonas sp.]